MLKRLSKLLKAAMAKFSISKETVRYTKYYKSMSVINNTLLIDNCKGITDSPKLLEELCNNENYGALKKYMVISDCKAVNADSKIELIKRFSKKHLKLLAQAEYIISDCFDSFYIKKDGQKCICTAKGDNFSQVQRSCIISDYILCSDQNELEYIRKSYMLDNIFTGKYIIGSLSGSKFTALDSSTCCNGKENVLIFTGALEKNGITTALKNLVNSVGDERNYIPFFYEKAVEPNKESVKELGGNAFISICGNMNMTLWETFVLALYYMNINIIRNTQKILDEIYLREIKRCFGDIKINHVIHFTGYARNVLQLICRINAKKYVWVHNNLFLEAKTKGNIHINTIKYGYDKCDRIVVVRDSMKEELANFVEPSQKEKITTVHNINNAVSVRQKALMPIEFQEDTYCNVTKEKLAEILENKNINKYINIARFSKEKGIDRLITAFDKYRRELDNSAYLIVIGGYGEEFDKIRETAKQCKNVILIKSIMNPYPILKQCDMFVLSSHYEGLPMTIIEALMLDVPVASTDITGPREFLRNGYGYLTPDSEQGIIDALTLFKNKALPRFTKFDVEKFNKDAINEFLGLF